MLSTLTVRGSVSASSSAVESLILQLRVWDYSGVLGKGRLQGLDSTPPEIVMYDPCIRNPHGAAVAVSAKELPPQSLCYCYF